MLGLGNGITSAPALESVALPTDLGDMVHYFKHKTGITNSSGVAVWLDQIATAKLAQSAAGRRPDYDASTGAIDFTNIESSSNSDRLEFASTQVFPAAFTIFFVAKLKGYTSGTGSYHGFSSSDAGSSMNFFDTTANLANTFFQMTFSDGSDTDSAVSAATNPDPLHDVKSLVVITVTDIDGGTIKCYFGGNDTNASSINEAHSSTLPNDNGFGITSIGHNAATPVRQLGAELFEWGSYSKALSAEEVGTLFSGINSRGLIG
tara:strand:+ start:446 stop:1231 length:786 start_codon:yes stop_codon:yes gene_type:complete